MITFTVPDMSCGHCVATITRAVHALDPAARVEVDLPRHRVAIESSTTDAAALAAALDDAGYTPTQSPD